MKRLILLPVLAFVLMAATCEDICMKEAQAHRAYMVTAPFVRTPAQILNAINYHNNVQLACATGKPLAIIKALIGKAEEARR